MINETRPGRGRKLPQLEQELLDELAHSCQSESWRHIALDIGINRETFRRIMNHYFMLHPSLTPTSRLVR
jgi:response regulator of citrate/malate metabolism